MEQKIMQRIWSGFNTKSFKIETKIKIYEQNGRLRQYSIDSIIT